MKLTPRAPSCSGQRSRSHPESFSLSSTSKSCCSVWHGNISSGNRLTPYPRGLMQYKFKVGVPVWGWPCNMSFRHPDPFHLWLCPLLKTLHSAYRWGKRGRAWHAGGFYWPGLEVALLPTFHRPQLLNAREAGKCASRVCPAPLP